MNREGPPLERLLRRLVEIPEDFLMPPKVPRRRGRVVTAAVVGDLLDRLAPTTGRAVWSPEAFTDRGAEGARRLAVVQVLCWLLADPSFAEEVRQGHLAIQRLHALLADESTELASQGSARDYVENPERREELARLALARAGLRPAGETKAQAEDRLTSLSAAERQRVLAASRAAQERARAVREALRRKAAEEAANKWTRE